MDANFSVKVVVIQGPEGKIMSDRRGFHANSLSQLVLSNAPARQHQEEKWLMGINSYNGSTDGKTLFRNRREYSCPSIIDFNAMKPYQELRPVHRPRRIFNGFFPSKVRVPPASHGLGNNLKTHDRQERVLEELVPDPSLSPLKRVVLSRNSHHSEPSISSQRSEPIPRSNEKQESTAAARRRALCSLRNGSPSPWVDRYKLKKKSITASQAADLKTKTPMAETFVRGFSR